VKRVAYGDKTLNRDVAAIPFGPATRLMAFCATTRCARARSERGLPPVQLWHEDCETAH